MAAGARKLDPPCWESNLTVRFRYPLESLPRSSALIHIHCEDSIVGKQDANRNNLVSEMLTAGLYRRGDQTTGRPGIRSPATAEPLATPALPPKSPSPPRSPLSKLTMSHFSLRDSSLFALRTTSGYKLCAFPPAQKGRVPVSCWVPSPLT